MRYTMFAVLVYAASLGAEVRKFSIPKDLLAEWARGVTAEMNAVKIGGNSNVHPVASDCEIHFGAHSSNFAGKPSGIVLEPMNACEAPFPGKVKFVKNDWVTFAKGINGQSVQVTGVPRIWPEHLGDPDDPDGGPPSNPNHAFEFHPLTKVTVGSKTNDFAKTIYAPDGFSGGLSESTAEKILSDTDVRVSESGGLVEIEFESGRIGNFTTFEINIRRTNIEEVPGGHRVKGQVVLSKSKTQTVTMVTVKGSKIDDRIAAFMSGRPALLNLEGLVLFSLDPRALFNQVSAGGGTVTDPIQLILFGEIDDEQ